MKLLQQFRITTVGGTNRAAGGPGTVAWGVVIVLVSGLGRLSSYQAPIERDTGQLLYGGMVVLHGGLPYRNAALNKGPLSYVLFAGIRLVIGRSELGLRLVLLGFAITSAFAAWAYVSRLVDPWTGRLAGLIVALLSSLQLFFGGDPNLEQFALAPMAVTLWLATFEGTNAALLTGALTAAVALGSPDFLIPLGPAVVLTTCRSRVGLRTRLAAELVGATAVCLVVAAWLIAGGALSDFVHLVPGTSGNFAPLSLAGLWTVRARGLWLLACAAGVVAFSRSGQRLGAAIAIVWMVSVWLRTNVGDPLSHDPTYPQHYYPAVLGIGIALALGIGALRGSLPLLIALGSSTVLAIAIAYVVLPEINAFRLPVAARGLGEYPYGDAYPLAAYVDEHTTSSQRIFVTASNPEIYWLADRFSSTRFFDVYPIYAHPAYQAERDADLHAHPPAAIVSMPPGDYDADTGAVIAKLGYRLAYQSPAGQVWLPG